MAEGILREKLKKIGFPATVDSCGFENYHVGDPPHSLAQKVARKYGTDISAHRGRLFTVRDFDNFDLIYVMESNHYQGARRLARNGSDMAKVDFTLNLLYPGKDMDVTDPWYYDEKVYEEVFLLLDKACGALAGKLASGSLP